MSKPEIITVAAGRDRVVVFSREAVAFVKGQPVKLTGPMPTDIRAAGPTDSYTAGDRPIELDLGKMSPEGAYSVRRLLRSGDLIDVKAARIAHVKESLATPPALDAKPVTRNRGE